MSHVCVCVVTKKIIFTAQNRYIITRDNPVAGPTTTRLFAFGIRFIEKPVLAGPPFFGARFSQIIQSFHRRLTHVLAPLYFPVDRKNLECQTKNIIIISRLFVSCKRTAAYSRSRRDAVTSRRDGQRRRRQRRRRFAAAAADQTRVSESGRAAAARAADDRLARPCRSAVRPAPVPPPPPPPPTGSTRRPAGRRHGLSPHAHGSYSTRK